MNKKFKFIYDGLPIIPPEIANMTLDELETEIKKCEQRHEERLAKLKDKKVAK